MTEHRSDTSPFGQDLWEVLARFVAGESSPSEASAVRDWLAADPRRQELVTALGKAVNGLASGPVQVDVEAALRRVSGRLREADVVELRPRRATATWLRAAAAIVVVAGAALVYREVNRPEPTVMVAERTYSTPVGRTDSIRLSDGSLAVLGPASTLTVAAGYGTSARPVQLRGVALFDVVHDSTRSFTVEAGGVVIEDLGTTFAVRSDGEEEVSVIVTAGSVRVQQGPQQGQQPPRAGGEVLKAGDRAAVRRDGGIERSTSDANDLAWMRGRLVFEDAPLTRVRADIRRWYGVELDLSDPALARRHLTASFSGESVDQVLHVIGLALGARIERKGDTAIVRSR